MADYSNYPAGKYEVQVTGQSVGKSLNTKTPYFQLYIQPLTYFGLNGEEDCSHGEPAKLTMYVTPKTIEARLRDLESLGYEGSSFSELNPENPNYHDFKGVKFLARNKHNEYQGNTNDQWEVEFESNDVPLEKSDLSALDKLFASKRKAKPAPKANGKPAPKVLEPVTSEADDDDSIPF